MTGFAASWLRLRETADDRARDEDLLARAAAIVSDRRGPEQAPLIVDLGGGSGATLRVLGPRTPGARWRILDADAALLALVPADPLVETVAVDLAARLGAAFTPVPDLIAASAFFDLVSARWIDGFVARLAAARRPLYAALTYDGRERWRPAPPHETAALAAFHADMRRDKGFGPALGPDAAAYLETALRDADFAVESRPSDWRLARPRDAALIDALAAGGAEALAAKMAAGDHDAWAAGRHEAEEAEVGHRDILARPIGA